MFIFHREAEKSDLDSGEIPSHEGNSRNDEISFYLQSPVEFYR